MPIDTSIYQQLRPAEAPDLLGMAGKVMTLSQLAMQNRKLKREEDESDALKSAFAKGLGPNGQFDRKLVLSELGKVNPVKALEVQSAFKKLESEDLEQKTKTLGFQINQLGAAGQLALSAKDQASYERALAQAKAMGLDVSQMPLQFDPGLVRQYAVLSLNQAERLQAQKQMLDEEITRGKAPLERKKLIADINKTNAETGKVLNESSPQKALTVGQKAADESFAKDAADYYYGGGKASVEKNIALLNSAIDELRTNPDLTGGISTRLPVLGSDTAQDTINPKMAAVRDQIRGAIQGTLKQVLGGQYTEREGQAIFNRAFNPRLSTQENVARATAELEALKRMAQEKDASMESFLAAGTLKGYRPGATNLALGSPQGPAPQGSGIPGVGTTYADGAGPKASPPKVPAGSVVSVGGKHYTVGPDGDTLIPVKGKAR